VNKSNSRYFINTLVIFITLFLLTAESIASTKHLLFEKKYLTMIAPPVINKDYYLLEFGFAADKQIKKWDYHYNAFVTASLFEDWLKQEHSLKAGALGFKAGVMLPTQKWIPLLFTFSAGFAKTTLHKRPIFGRDKDSVDKKDMFLLESGLLYRYDDYFIRFNYQFNTVKYFKRKTFFMLGVSY
jgi:hypothetical protein